MKNFIYYSYYISDKYFDRHIMFRTRKIKNCFDFNSKNKELDLRIGYFTELKYDKEIRQIFYKGKAL